MARSEAADVASVIYACGTCVVVGQKRMHDGRGHAVRWQMHLLNVKKLVEEMSHCEPIALPPSLYVEDGGVAWAIRSA